MSGAAERRVRLFFALWPSAAMQVELAAAASPAIGALRSGRPVPRENLHLTLAFLGSVPQSALQTLDEIARAASEPSTVVAVEVTFDVLEYWRRAQIVCAAARSAPHAASAFTAALKQKLTGQGFAPDLKPFRPHVTLARQVRHEPLALPLAEVRWTFRDFALVESRSRPGGSLYSVRACWPLYSG
jgi:RNA 2',3'-cyclic 3'-phosphodiesterase